MHATQDLLLAMARFRSDTREIIVDTLRQAGDEVLRRPGAIAGGVEDGSIYAAYLHTVDVEESWLQVRLLEIPEELDGPDPARYADFESIAAIWAQTSADWLAYLAAHDDAYLWDVFESPSGKRAPRCLVAFHVFNHTTHHVAEMWTALTAAGISPPELDAVAWAAGIAWPFDTNR